MFIVSSLTPLYAGAGKQFLVSIGDLKENQSMTWKKRTCDQIYNLANRVIDGGANVTCRTFDTDSFAATGVSDASTTYDYHLRILRTSKNEIDADVVKLRRVHDSDFTGVGWKFKDGTTSKISKESAMAKALGNFFYYADHETAFKAGLLVNGAAESNEFAYDQKKGKFIDKITGSPMSIDAAFTRFESESPRKKNYLRTGIQIGVILSAGLAGYYAALELSRVDFDYSLSGKLSALGNGSAFAFDDNAKTANYGHEFAGVLYAQAARANGFNTLESFLIAFASSTVWELTEYREVFAINDQILTPLGGYLIGESSYQLACSLLQKNSTAAKVLAYALNPALAANHGIDTLKGKDKYASQLDCKKERWSDISVMLGLEVGQKAYDPKTNVNAFAGIDATVINVENYEEAGKTRKLLYDTAMTKTQLEVNSNDGAMDLRLIAQVVHAAYFQKNISTDENGQKLGYAVQIGLGSASSWSDRGTTELKSKANEDFYGTVSILGATAHADLFYKGYRVSADLAFYGDFTMVKSYALSKYDAANPGAVDGLSSVMQMHGYYWGLGTSTIASVSVQKGKWEVGYNVQYSDSSSLDWRLRHEENITNHTEFKDSMFVNRAYVSYAITKNLKIKLMEEIITRSGAASDGTEKEGTEYRTMGLLEYQF